MIIPDHAAPTGKYFDHIVIIAMENQDYSSVIGNSAAPFINGLAAVGSTMSSYHSYGAGTFSGDTIGGCSAACYVAFMGGDTYSVSDGYGCCLSGQTFVDQMQASGLTWQAYCESGCPRGPDHFPFIAFSADVNSPNVFASSSVSTSNFVSAANSGNPPNFLWFTPTDSHNMHDNSVSTGDSYLQQFLVGSGTVQNPASGSLLASNVFKNSGFHTMLYLWWDEYDPSPNVEYGSMVKTGYTSTTSYDEYSSLRTLEDNWGLSHLANVASAVGLTDLLTTGGGSQPVQTTAAVINSGIYPTRDWLTQKHTYSSTGVPSSGTLVEIKNAVLSSVANGASSGDCNDSRDTPPAPSGTWCDSTADASDGTGTVHVEIDQVYKYLGIAPADWPSNGATVDIIGYTFMDGEGGGTSWEIHPVTAWSLSGSSSGMFTLTVSAGSGGSTSPAPGSYSEASGSVVTVTAVPSSGYTFNGFTLDGVVSASNPILVTMNANHAVSASFSQSVSTTGNFGSCTSLPQGWNCDNTNGLTGSVATVVNGVAETVQASPGVGSDNSYYYSTTQKGTFPWSPCQAPASGVLSTGLSSVSSTFTVNDFQPSGSYRYHIYIALYYWLPNGPLTSGGSTYQCLDTQVRVENINGVFSPVGSTGTYNPGDSFGWDQITIGSVSVGGTYTLTADVQQQCQSDLAAWGLPTNTPCQLAGIEIGVEGYQFSLLNVYWTSVSLSTGTGGGPPPLSGSFSFSPTSPTVSQTVTFTGSAAGGVSPYGYSWSYGDGSTGSGQTASHAYAAAGSYIVKLTVSDSAGHTSTTSQTVAVTLPLPPDFSMAASPTSLTVQAGSSGSSTIQLSSINGFSGTVLLTSTVSPSSGLTCTLIPTTIILSASSTSLLSCNGSVGTYAVTVRSTSGSLSHSATVTFNLVAVGFSINPSPTSVAAATGVLGTSTVMVSSIGGFAGTVVLASSVSPSTGLNCSLSPTSITLGTSGTSTLSCDGAAGTYTVIVRGTSGSSTSSNTVTFTVSTTNPVPDFSISASSSPLTIQTGHSEAANITLASVNGFSGIVSLTAHGDSGLNVSLSLDHVNISPGSSTTLVIRITVLASASIGFYTASVDASYGSTTHQTTVPVEATDSQQPYPPPGQQPGGQGFLWQISQVMKTNSWMLLLGVLSGFILTLTVFYLRARSRLSEAEVMKRLMRRAGDMQQSNIGLRWTQRGAHRNLPLEPLKGIGRDASYDPWVRPLHDRSPAHVARRHRTSY